jgi:hypothetical protein
MTRASHIVVFAVGVMLAAVPAYATDAQKAAKPQQQGQKAPQKGDQTQKRSDTGPQGEEQTGGAGPSGPSSGGNVKAPQHEGAEKKPTH